MNNYPLGKGSRGKSEHIYKKMWLSGWVVRLYHVHLPVCLVNCEALPYLLHIGILTFGPVHEASAKMCDITRLTCCHVSHVRSCLTCHVSSCLMSCLNDRYILIEPTSSKESFLDCRFTVIISGASRSSIRYRAIWNPRHESVSWVASWVFPLSEPYDLKFSVPWIAYLCSTRSCSNLHGNASWVYGWPDPPYVYCQQKRTDRLQRNGDVFLEI